MDNTTRMLLKVLQGEDNQALKLLRGPYSQAELAIALEVNPTTVFDWENGTNSPSPKNVRALLVHARTWAASLGLKLTDVLELCADRWDKPQPTAAPERK